MDKLISMTALTIKLEKQLKRCKDEGMTFSDLQTLKQKILNQLFLYANFLSQPLNISMFIPCKLVDSVWVVLPMHIFSDNPNKSMSKMYNEHPLVKEYQEAKERVLFEGFNVDLNGTCIICISNENTSLDYSKSVNLFSGLSIIEDLVKYNLTLTLTAKKQIEL